MTYKNGTHLKKILKAIDIQFGMVWVLLLRKIIKEKMKYSNKF